MWTLKYFKEIHDRFESSGLSVKDFCHNECILQSKFYYWKRKMRDQQQPKDQQPGFVPLVITSGGHSNFHKKEAALPKPTSDYQQPLDNNAFEIVYPNGVKLRVPVGADLAYLRTLILLFQ